MKFKLVAALGLSTSLLGGAAAWAHHSGAMFDRNKDVSLTGTLKEIQWVQPHAWIEILVPGADGKPQEWSIEMGGGPANFPQLGITKTYPKVGDKLTIVAHPLKDGRPGGSFVSIVLPDGRNMGQARPPTGGAAAPANP